MVHYNPSFKIEYLNEELIFLMAWEVYLILSVGYNIFFVMIFVFLGEKRRHMPMAFFGWLIPIREIAHFICKLP